MKRRSMLALALALALVFAFVGCSSSSGTTTTTTAATTTAATTTVGGGDAADTGNASGATDAAGGGDAKANSDISVIMVTMDGLDNHWVNANVGAQAAADELGVKYQWMTPDRKDTALQIEILNNAIAAQCDALLVAAVDPEAIVATLQSAVDAGIKVIYVDSVANFEALATFATDNYAAARVAGEQMITALTEKNITSGDIGIVAFSNATQTSVYRENGFRDAFEGTGYTLLETQYGNSEVAASQAAAENFITQGVVGVYGNNEPGAVGVGNAAAANADWNGVAVGFDASETTLDLVDSGALYCVMAQNPYNMGFGAVNMAVKAVKGEELGETQVDTGASVVTVANTADFRAK